MELQQLRYVIPVAETLSFTRAHVTQSALSHQIAALERGLGQALFARSSRSVRLTEAGAAFLPHARTALAAAARAAEDAASANGSVVGTLRVGMIPTVTAVPVPALLARFRRRHPSTRAELHVGNSTDLMEAIRRDELDLALLGLHESTPPSGVSARELVRERLVAVLPREHRLAGSAGIGLADLAGEDFADFPAGTSGRAQSEEAFRAAELDRQVAYEVDSASLLLDLVGAGLAVALLAPGVVGGARRRRGRRARGRRAGAGRVRGMGRPGSAPRRHGLPGRAGGEP